MLLLNNSADNPKHNKIYFIFFIQLLIFYLINLKTQSYLLCWFGFSLFIIPVLFISLEWFLKIWLVFNFLDCFPMFLSFSFCGKITEYLVYFNRLLYYVPSCALIAFFIFQLISIFLYRRGFFESLDSEKKLIKEEDFSDLIIEAINPLKFDAKIFKRIPTYHYTKYYINFNKLVNYHEFMSLSSDLSNIFDLRIRNNFDLKHFSCEIENLNNNIPRLKNFQYALRPNSLFINKDNTPQTIGCKKNFLIYGSRELIKSIITSLFVSKMNLKIFISVHEDTLNFLKPLAIKNINTSIEFVLKEIEKRYKLILNYGKNIQEYNQKHETKLESMLFVIELTKETFNENLPYVLHYSERVGIFIYFYSSDFNIIESYGDLFSNVISSKIKDVSLSLKLLNTTHGAFLTNFHGDCLVKENYDIQRVSFPIISPNDLQQVNNYFNTNIETQLTESPEPKKVGNNNQPNKKK